MAAAVPVFLKDQAIGNTASIDGAGTWSVDIDLSTYDFSGQGGGTGADRITEMIVDITAGASTSITVELLDKVGTKVGSRARSPRYDIDSSDLLPYSDVEGCVKTLRVTNNAGSATGAVVVTATLRSWKVV